jgi:isopentenyl diphosphate isomerase/L-lactate dehydrogenase-like FMN-dependent dehydrogenase
VDDLPRVLGAFEARARERLEPGPLAYYASGAGAEVTLRDNVAAWERLRLAPRMLVGVGERDLSTTVLGRRRPHPLVVAPMAYQRLAHPGGEGATCAAAAAHDAIFTLSTLATTAPRELTGGTRWFQVYVFRDRGVTRALVEQAAEAGFEALVLTVDLPVLGLREADHQLGWHLPADIGIPSVDATGSDRRAMTIADTAALLDADLRWEDLAELAAGPLPVLVKGVLRPDDARRAVEHGAAGVIVSNHGGRQLDTVLATADALPAVVQEVGSETDVLVDGGIRRGTDVLKALALGARAVMVGRPVLWGLACGGQAGAERVLELLLADLDRSLALAGTPVAGEIPPDLIA